MGVHLFESDPEVKHLRKQDACKNESLSPFVPMFFTLQFPHSSIKTELNDLFQEEGTKPAWKHPPFEIRPFLTSSTETQ